MTMHFLNRRSVESSCVTMSKIPHSVKKIIRIGIAIEKSKTVSEKCQRKIDDEISDIDM